MKDQIKIQINSLEALERLIGGDSSLEFDIRNNVVQNFAKKYLKAVVNSEQIKALEKSIKDELWSKSGYTTVLNPKIKKMIDDAATNHIKTTLDNKVCSAKIELDKMVIDKLNDFTDTIADTVIENLQQEKMKELINYKVERKFKSMLKIINEQNNAEQKVSSIENL